jgi:hypothetical protein
VVESVESAMQRDSDFDSDSDGLPDAGGGVQHLSDLHVQYCTVDDSAARSKIVVALARVL